MSRRTGISATTLRVEAALIALLKHYGPMDSRDVKAQMAEQGFTVNQTTYARVRLKLCLMHFGHVRGKYTWWSLPRRLPSRHLDQAGMVTAESEAGSAPATHPAPAGPGDLHSCPQAGQRQRCIEKPK